MRLGRSAVSSGVGFRMSFSGRVYTDERRCGIGVGVVVVIALLYRTQCSQQTSPPKNSAR